MWPLADPNISYHQETSSLCKTETNAKNKNFKIRAMGDDTKKLSNSRKTHWAYSQTTYNDNLIITEFKGYAIYMYAEINRY